MLNITSKGNTQGAVNYMLSVGLQVSTSPKTQANIDCPQEIVVFNIDFPTDTTDIKFRALQWILTEIMLAMAALWNLLPREYSSLREHNENTHNLLK